MARDHSRGSRPVVARAEGAGKTELTSGPGLSGRNGRHAVLGERRTCGARVSVAEGACAARTGRLGWPAWELGRGAGLRGERGKEELGWVAWVEARLGFPFFPILFLFYFKHHSNLFEFKPNLNSKPYALNQRKLMHQHECTNMFKPREILITRERKFN